MEEQTVFVREFYCKNRIKITIFIFVCEKKDELSFKKIEYTLGDKGSSIKLDHEKDLLCILKSMKKEIINVCLIGPSGSGKVN